VTEGAQQDVTFYNKAHDGGYPARSEIQFEVED
jgi:hypothetical protein